jgi:hypothetical protein
MVSARGGDNLFNIDREHHPVAFPHLDLIQASGTTYFVHVGVNLAVQSCHRSQGRSDDVNCPVSPTADSSTGLLIRG